MATESDVMVQEEPEGFSTEAALCLLYNGLNVYTVLTVIALSMVLTGHKRRYTACRTRSPAQRTEGYGPGGWTDEQQQVLSTVRVRSIGF